MKEQRTSSKDRRPSLHADALEKSADGITSSKMSSRYLAGERRLSVTSMRLRSEVEMWLMEEVPKLFEVADSNSLTTSMQEDAQSEFLNKLLFDDGKCDDATVLRRIAETFGDSQGKQSETFGARYDAFEKALADKISEVRSAFASARKQSKEIPKNEADVSVVNNGAGDPPPS